MISFLKGGAKNCQLSKASTQSGPQHCWVIFTVSKLVLKSLLKKICHTLNMSLH